MLGILLYTVAIVLISVLLIPGLIFGFCVKRSKRLPNKLLNMAELIDIFGNVACAELFNACLIKNSVHLFGNKREWISSVLGKNIKTGTLTRTGKVLVYLLTEKHCINQIIEL